MLPFKLDDKDMDPFEVKHGDILRPGFGNFCYSFVLAKTTTTLTQADFQGFARSWLKFSQMIVYQCFEGFVCICAITSYLFFFNAFYKHVWKL